MLSLGIIWSERCTLWKVAERMAGVLSIRMDSGNGGYNAR